jgi:autotransporter family porin
MLGLSEPALAQTCTGLPNPVCTGAPFTNINFDSEPNPIILTLQSGVQVIANGSVVNAVSAFNTGGPSTVDAPATLIANDAAVTHTVRDGPDQSALIVQASGDATITASGIINVTGTASTNAIWAINMSNLPSSPVASVIYDGPLTGPGITETGGADSTLIQACGNDGCQLPGNAGVNAKIDAAGDLKGIGVSAASTTGMNGLFAVAGGDGGDATANYHRGTIDITQMDTGIVAGIFASSGDVGSATIKTDSGTTVNVRGQGSPLFGIDAFASGGDATANVASTILIDAAPPTSTSTYRRNPTGIIVTTDPNATTDPIGSASVSYTGPGITVHGGGGLGIVAVAGSPDSGSASGPVTVDASGATGPIVADGSNAVGILADSGTLRNIFRSGPSSPTTTTGTVVVNASNVVSAQGQFGVGISATGGSGGVMVNIPSSGSIMGGWQPDVNSVGVTYGLPAAGVILGSSVGAATLTNNGTIGALSDRAIASPLPSFFANPPSFPTSFPTSNNTSIINNGTITGFVQLVGGDNSILNNGTFDLRHFADTTGAASGVRDTVRVAVADLGTGLNNTFTNNGTLALAQVTGATVVPTGQYLPLGNINNTMTPNGPLQGQIIGAATFTNSGIIDLQANPVPGDVLMITGGRGGPTPGTGGGGTYISNGGTLKLDTVLNEGGPATVSDTLVVDGTQVGAKGPTNTEIRDAAAGTLGALTVGDGILVVQVLDPTRSKAGAFVLAGGELEAGPWDYRLFQGGPSGNTSDWFLRSTFIPPVPEPTPPEPPVPLPPNVDPIIGPRWATYGVVQPLARQLGLDILGTLHERGGDTFEPDCVATAAATELPTKKSADGLPTKKPGPAPVSCALAVSPSVWARFFGGTFNDRYDAFAEPRADGNFLGLPGRRRSSARIGVSRSL